MNRGFLQIIVLVALEKSTYGYMLLKDLDQKGYEMEESTLYPLLRRLEKNELIKSHWNVSGNRPKKFYLISEEGKQVREKLLAIWKRQNHILNSLIKDGKNV